MGYKIFERHTALPVSQLALDAGNFSAGNVNPFTGVSR